MYVDAATRFAQTGTIDISALSVPVAIFESVFGGVVVLLFGSSVAALGLGSAFLAAVAGIALYDILRRGGLEQVSAALVTGVFLFAPFLGQIRFPEVVGAARLPGSKQIPALSYLLSFLALKLLGTER